jgi:hypothetical protein
VRNLLDGVKIDTPPIYELDSTSTAAETFRQAALKAKENNKFGAGVDVLDADKYAGMRLFLADGGKAGFALDGNKIVSVFSSSDMKGLGHSMVLLAKQCGATALECPDTILPHLFSAHDFRAVSRAAWDESAKPAGWDKATYWKFNNGEPDRVYMALDPDYDMGYRKGDGRMFSSREDAAAHRDLQIRSEPPRSEAPGVSGGGPFVSGAGTGGEAFSMARGDISVGTKKLTKRNGK